MAVVLKVLAGLQSIVELKIILPPNQLTCNWHAKRSVLILYISLMHLQVSYEFPGFEYFFFLLFFP